jgi:UPF0755 protein
MKFKNGTPKPKIRLKTILLVSALSLVFAACALTAGLKHWYQSNLRPLSRQSSEVVVAIPAGYSTEAIAKLLQSESVIKNATAFEWYIRFAHLRDSLQAGEYTLDPSLSVQQITDMLANGKVNTKLFTILPAHRDENGTYVSSLDQIKATFLDDGFSQSEIEAAFDPFLYANHPALATKPAEASLEGYLYPESYQMTSSTTVRDIIEMSLDQMDLALTADILAGFAQQGLTQFQGITLASIVEQEASSFTDRQIVAGVFLNRLKIGMTLGSDVTYHYIAAITGQDPTPFIDSPYNTRMYAGLPPGPISNVSSSSLEAVANPTPSDYLFFVAGDPIDGISTIYFSKTQAEHEALARQYCIELCSTY